MRTKLPTYTLKGVVTTLFNSDDTQQGQLYFSISLRPNKQIPVQIGSG
jgi:hypothetical protein